MTIRNREWNNHLSNLESCVQDTPAETFPEARCMVDMLGEIFDAAAAVAGRAGLRIPNNDAWRDVEAAIYAAVKAHNPGKFETAEGYGEAMNGPAAERIRANFMRDYRFIQSMKVGQ